nr:recombinase family protein [uncultured Terrisporobacter sp.]
MRYYAYHRTSTTDQHLDRGINTITEFCKNNDLKLDNKIYTDQCTGKNFNRPGYTDLIDTIKYQIETNNEKVTLIVSELDRLGRNKELTLKEIRMLKDLGVRLMVIEIPTTCQDLSKLDDSLAGMMMETINNMLIEMYVSFAHAEMEKRATRQREGIEAKKARGEWDDFGRPRVLDFDKFTKEYKRVLNGDIKPGECMKLLGITKPTYYRYKKEFDNKEVK